nr:immunoglobulin heavy chain junction region [Macaca mulatta]MOX05309.1 immunoglobulin heavy chain junction region [Macaca mulatta]
CAGPVGSATSYGLDSW